MYILNPYEEGYILRYKYEKTIYVYMLIRYCTLVRYCTHIFFIFIFKKKVKVRDVTLWYQSCSNLRRPKGYGIVYVCFS